jgi:hypothetical protein
VEPTHPARLVFVSPASVCTLVQVRSEEEEEDDDGKEEAEGAANTPTRQGEGAFAENVVIPHAHAERRVVDTD